MSLSEEYFYTKGELVFTRFGVKFYPTIYPQQHHQEDTTKRKRERLMPIDICLKNTNNNLKKKYEYNHHQIGLQFYPTIQKNNMIMNEGDKNNNIKRNGFYERDKKMLYFIRGIESFFQTLKTNYKGWKIPLLYQEFVLYFNIPFYDIDVETNVTPLSVLGKKKNLFSKYEGTFLDLSVLAINGSSDAGRKNLNKGGDNRLQIDSCFKDKTTKKEYRFRENVVLLRKRALGYKNVKSLRKVNNNEFIYYGRII